MALTGRCGFLIRWKETMATTVGVKSAAFVAQKPAGFDWQAGTHG